MNTIRVVLNGGIWLQCFAGNPDADRGMPVEILDPGDSWELLAAKVAEHQAAHGCGPEPQPAATAIAGMPVRAEPPDLTAVLAAVAVIKGLDKDGNVSYWPLSTEGVTPVEAIGMHEAASCMHKARLPK